MTPVASRTDPRSVITPDAFHVAPELLGLKLASGRRRLAAIMIDLVVIGVLTLVTRSFAVVLGLVVAVALVRAGFKRTTARGTVLHRAMRASVGCLGLGIGILTVVLWLGDVNDDGRDDPCLVRGNRLLCDTAHRGAFAATFPFTVGAGEVPRLGDVNGI